MSTLKNHPSMWLRDDAAASLARFEAKYGVQPINSAGRTVAEQQKLINRWNIGGAANRPPHLYQPAPATGPNASRHVTNGGTAIDTSNAQIFHDHGAEYGWLFLFSYDKVHFEYNPAYDKHKSSGSGTPLPAADQTVKNEQNWLNVSRGEKLVTDGKLGPATKAAIARYQKFLKKYGYTGAADGVWGPGTQAAHAKYYAEYHAPKGGTAKAVIKKGSKGADVKLLQQTLNKKYPAYSKLAEDGQFGTGTENVVKEFQRRAGLTRDGIVGHATWTALGL